MAREREQESVTFMAVSPIWSRTYYIYGCAACRPSVEARYKDVEGDPQQVAARVNGPHSLGVRMRPMRDYSLANEDRSVRYAD